MAKKRDYSAEYEQIVDNTKIIPTDLEMEMKKSFIAYAMAVNVSRAIPDARDGLKPVQRRILYAMNESGYTHDKPYKKCATTVGDVLGRYHPHGDSSVYGALVRLAQDFSIRYTLVDGHGNFGSVDGDPPAAYRYTEARLSKLADEMLRDIDKDTVDFIPNFDETRKQPVVLPSRFPNLLVNGSDGIAVGMATNIPPHNLNEVVDAIVAQIKNPDITIDELMEIIPAPDYPTGGVIMGKAALKNAYLTGRGGVVVRARTEIEETDKHSRILIHEIPYQVNKSELIMSIADLVKNKRIEGISDIKDESDRKGMRIVIDIKHDAQPQVVLNYLYKHTALQTGFGINFLALVDGQPKTLNLKQLLAVYIDHQKEVVLRKTKYDLARAEERAHILEGLVVALANIDDVIATIKASVDRQDAMKKLMEAYLLDELQANAILDMKLQRLTSLEVEKLNEELKGLIDLIAEYKGIIASEAKILEIISNDLLEIKEKFGDERKSEVSVDVGDIDIADLIEKEDVVISLTHFGYIKRIPVSEYKTQHRGGMGVTGHKPKEEDFVESMFISNTHDDILYFTNTGKVYCTKAYEIPEAQKNARGRAIVNLLELSEGESVETIIPLNERSEGFLVIATKKGLIKKTALSEYANIRKSGKIAISLMDGDTLVGAKVTNGDQEIMVASHYGKTIRVSEKSIRATSRDTMGVKSMSMEPGDYLVDVLVLSEGKDVLTITENAFGKRCSQEEYRLQGRNGKGVKAGMLNEKTGNVVNIKLVGEDDDVMIIADNGVIIRVPANSISRVSRNTQGVRIMKLKDEAKVVSVAIADKVAEDLTEDGGETLVIGDDVDVNAPNDEENV
ncbi:MAG: DNA gyrase subunit A [Clostridia bacterium]|nr:DNA gyrase subunit A [Clostridia bacterium]